MSRNARRGIFFNLDRILADSGAAVRGAFDRFAAHYGAASDDDVFKAIGDPPLLVAVATLKRRWSLAQGLDELLRHYTELVDNAFLKAAPAPGAAATLETAFRNGWAVGVVTANSGARTRAWLARTRLARHVDIVVGGDEVCLGKPEAEPYRIALARSGCAREFSIAVEDSPNGAKAAIGAGIRSYAIAFDANAPTDWPDTVRLIGSLDELIPELERLRTRRVARRG